MKQYESIHLVKGEDLNHHGTLFAARAASWFVESGFAAAACEHGNPDEIVLRSLQNMSFSVPVEKGAVVAFRSRAAYAGRTSLVVHIEAADAISGTVAVEGFITFVTIDKETRQKKPHGVVLDETTDEKELEQRRRAWELSQDRGISNRTERSDRSHEV